MIYFKLKKVRKIIAHKKFKAKRRTLYVYMRIYMHTYICE